MSTKKASVAKIGLYVQHFVTEVHNLLISFSRPSEMLLSNQGHMTSCVKLSGQPDIKLKIATQIPKTYMYPLFCISSTITTASEN